MSIEFPSEMHPRVILLVPHEVPRHKNRTFAFEEPDRLGHRILRWNRDHHVIHIRHFSKISQGIFLPWESGRFFIEDQAASGAP